MSIRTWFQRWRIGADRYDGAIAAIYAAENAEAEGRAISERFIRDLHAKYPDPDRRCSVPHCCGGAA